MPHYKHADPKRKITPQTLDTFMGSDIENWVKALFVFLYYFGVRITEALGTNVRDLEVIPGDEGDMLHVTVPTLKNTSQDSRRLWVPIDQPYVMFLIAYAKERDTGALWTYTREWCRRKMQTVYPWITPHGFRHNRLDTFAQERATPFELKSWAGWSDVRPAEAYVQAMDTRAMAKRHFKNKTEDS